MFSSVKKVEYVLPVTKNYNNLIHQQKVSLYHYSRPTTNRVRHKVYLKVIRRAQYGFQKL